MQPQQIEREPETKPAHRRYSTSPVVRAGAADGLSETAMTGDLLIVGGGGGRRIAALLAPDFPGHVVIGGRTVESAQSTCAHVGSGTRARRAARRVLQILRAEQPERCRRHVVPPPDVADPLTAVTVTAELSAKEEP